MDPKKKPKFSTFQCLRYLFRLAWQNQKIVLVIMLLEPLAQVAANALKLFMAPKILEIVSAKAPIVELGLTISLFAISLFLLNTIAQHCLEWDYCNKNALLLQVNSFLDEKCCNTSYPNMENAEFKKLYEEASPAAGNQHSAAVSFIWSNLSNLLQNIFGFVLYLFIIGNLNPILSITVIAISAISYALNQWRSNLGYNQMEEMYTYIGQMNYISQKAESVQLAKDIRIFGLQDWLRDIYRSSFAMFDSLAKKQQVVYFLVNALDVCLSFLRNGIAYWYLIAMAIKGDLSASEFLLYFTAFTGFSAWVTGLLSEFADLREECQKISYVLEFLNFPEPFRFSGGVPVPKLESYEIRLEHVTFSYPKAEKAVLEDLNLTIHPGEKLAVVGLNGAGKTTLIKLICGFYDPQEGESSAEWHRYSGI